MNEPDPKPKKLQDELWFRIFSALFYLVLGFLLWRSCQEPSARDYDYSTIHKPDYRQSSTPEPSAPTTAQMERAVKKFGGALEGDVIRFDDRSLGKNGFPLFKTGELSCIGTSESGSVYFLTNDEHASKLYAVNGNASAVGEPIHPIWLSNPDIPGTKRDIGPLIALGLKLCDYKGE